MYAVYDRILVILQPKIPYAHRINMVLANPKYCLATHHRASLPHVSVCLPHTVCNGLCCTCALCSLLFKTLLLTWRTLCTKVGFNLHPAHTHPRVHPRAHIHTHRHKHTQTHKGGLQTILSTRMRTPTCAHTDTHIHTYTHSVTWAPFKQHLGFHAR